MESYFIGITILLLGAIFTLFIKSIPFQFIFFLIKVHLVGALSLAGAAGDAAIHVADDLILRIQKINRHFYFTP